MHKLATKSPLMYLVAGQPLWHRAQLWGRMLHFWHSHIQISCIILLFCRCWEMGKKENDTEWLKRAYVTEIEAGRARITKMQPSHLTAVGEKRQHTKFITSKIWRDFCTLWKGSAIEKEVRVKAGEAERPLEKRKKKKKSNNTVFL